MVAPSGATWESDDRPAERGRTAGISVIPPGDTPGVGTQLRLINTPRPSGGSAGGRTGRRAVRWPEWRLDARARTVGRRGVAQARAALEREARPDPELPKAS